MVLFVGVWASGLTRYGGLSVTKTGASESNLLGRIPVFGSMQRIKGLEKKRQPSYGFG